jgi:hypothetical protein
MPYLRTMSTPASDDVLAALRDFVARIDALDPAARPVGELTLRLGDEESRLDLRTPVARALVEALRTYHDPRDRGHCVHCGGRRIDDNFLCQDCGKPNGVFGQMLAERAADYVEPMPIMTPETVVTTDRDALEP